MIIYIFLVPLFQIVKGLFVTYTRMAGSRGELGGGLASFYRRKRGEPRIGT